LRVRSSARLFCVAGSRKPHGVITGILPASASASRCVSAVQVGVQVRTEVCEPDWEWGTFQGWGQEAALGRTSMVLGMAAPPRMLRLAATNDSGATSWSPTLLL